MTELFGRLAPGADLESARAELRVVHAAMLKQHPEAYSAKADFRVDALRLRDQITSRARTVLLVLLVASGLVFLIACSNVANLVLARTVRRERELAIRAALGAGTGALRRMLLAESVLLCGAGAVLGVLSARPLVAILARYASRFSVRALDLTVDSTMVSVGAALAVVAAILLAFVPRLPFADASYGSGLASGGTRITGSAGRRQRVFAVIQIAASFVLLAGAATLLKTLIALQAVQTGFDMRHVLAVNVPVMSYGRTPDQITAFYQEAVRRISELPGVDQAAIGTTVPWRDAGNLGPGFGFSADGHVRAPGEEDPRARFRIVSPGFFAALGVPIIAGRDFNEADRRGSELVTIVSQSLASRMFPNGDAVNRQVMWTDPVMKFIDVSPAPRRIVGVAADMDDENVVPGMAITIYHPFRQEMGGGRIFVHSRADPYALVTPIRRIIRDMSADQPVEHSATLEDVRAEVLTPDRLNAVVFGVVRVCRARHRFGGRCGSAGLLRKWAHARVRHQTGGRFRASRDLDGRSPGRRRDGARGHRGRHAVRIRAPAPRRELFSRSRTPGALPLTGSALILLAASVVASMLPALRAAQVDVIQALRID